MKVKVLSLLVPALLVAGAANAAEIYNKVRATRLKAATTPGRVWRLRV